MVSQREMDSPVNTWVLPIWPRPWLRHTDEALQRLLTWLRADLIRFSLTCHLRHMTSEAASWEYSLPNLEPSSWRMTVSSCSKSNCLIATCQKIDGWFAGRDIEAHWLANPHDNGDCRSHDCIVAIFLHASSGAFQLLCTHKHCIHIMSNRPCPSE